MSTQLNPYLTFRASAREAMEFYHSVFGGDLTISTFADFQASGDPAEQDKVMHAMLSTDGGLVLMASDTPDQMDYVAGSNFSISLSGENEAELRGYWAMLSDGGTVAMPLGPAPWGDTFGMCSDKYGVNWLINITVPEAAMRS
jgi:PhnB protein